MCTPILLVTAALLLSACGSKNSQPGVETDTTGTHMPGAAPPPPSASARPAPPPDTARLAAMQREIDKLKQKVDDKGAASTGKSSSERVRFEAGRSSTTINAVANPGARKEYILGARSGQALTVRLDSRNDGVLLSITGPGGRKLLENGTSYSAELESDGDYRIVVQGGEKAPKATGFSLYTEIR